MNRIYQIILFALSLSPQFLQGQVPYFQKYFLSKKNESVQVNAILQDKEGFIWYGTTKGLFKFNGENIRRFAVAEGLPDETITAIAQDSLGRIWMGCRNGKIARIEKNGITQFEPAEGTSTEEISDMLFDKNGNLWFATLNDGLYYYVKDRLYRLDETDGITDLFIYDLLEDNAGNIWAGTDGGVAVCKLVDRKVDVTLIDAKNGLPDNIIKKLGLNQQNNVVMATEDAGIITYDLTTKKCTSVIKNKWAYGSITDFVFNDNKVWISVAQLGVVVYDTRTEELKVYSSKISPILASVNLLANDFEGNIWLGTKTGVLRTHSDYLETIDDLKITKNVNVLALTIDRQNNLWFSNGDGLFKRVVDKQGFATVTSPLRGTSYQNNTIISLFCDWQGFIWAGLYGEGVLRIDPATAKIIHLNKELRNGNVLSITGKNNTIWLATLGGGTKIKLEGTNLAIQNYSKQNGLISDYIYQIFIDSKERVWFATDGKGVDMLDKNGFHHLTSGLTTEVVFGFVEDANHDIWANIQGEGLYKFESDAFTRLKKNKLRDNNINALAVDHSGNIVVMHDLGIDVVDNRRGEIHHIEQPGIHIRMANLNAVAKDRFGRLYFGTEGGIVSYSRIFDEHRAKPKPVIEAIRILNENAALKKELVLKHDQNSITINYHGFWYQSPENLNFRYSLLNYDHDWITSRDHSATYSSLPPGEYTFNVSVSETEDFTNAAKTTFEFTINPPIWRTKTFYVSVLVLAIALGHMFLTYRERKLVRAKNLLEEKVEERTQEIQKKNEEIQSQAEEIRGINENLEMMVRERTFELEKKNRALEESAFIIAHELRAPVASILGLINLISKTKLDEEGRTIVKHMEDSAERLNSIVRTITKAIERGDNNTINRD
jgi:ligand-binding sensor domain-containing protein